MRGRIAWQNVRYEHSCNSTPRVPSFCTHSLSGAELRTSMNPFPHGAYCLASVLLNEIPDPQQSSRAANNPIIAPPIADFIVA